MKSRFQFGTGVKKVRTKVAVKVRRMSRRLSLFASKTDEETEASEVQDTQEGIENEVFDQEDENQITDFMTQRLSVASIGKEARKSSRSDDESQTTQESDCDKPDQTGRRATKVRIDSNDSSCKECKAELMCPGCTHPNNMAKDIEKILANMNKESQDDVYQNIVTLIRYKFGLMNFLGRISANYGSLYLFDF